MKKEIIERGYCPHCGEKDDYVREIVMEGEAAIADCECHKCFKSFREIFEITSILKE